MTSNDLRATILVSAAAALGVALAACGGEKPARAPNLGVTEVPPSGSGSSHVMPSGSTMESSCGGGAGHSCGAMKDKSKPGDKPAE